MAKESVVIPDLGNADDVDVIELSVKPGDVVVVDQSLIVLESAKATMEVPSSVAGTVLALTVKVGDKVKSGAVIAEIETAAASAAAEKNPPPQKVEPAPMAAPSPKPEKATVTTANNASPPANET
ncbi:MAG: biotin/lipoyl-binding protein, partial [Cellvibrionales bacterium]